MVTYGYKVVFCCGLLFWPLHSRHGVVAAVAAVAVAVIAAVAAVVAAVAVAAVVPGWSFQVFWVAAKLQGQTRRADTH